MSGRVAGAHLGGILGEGDVADVVQGLNPPVVGSVVAGAERGPDRLGRVGGPLGDRGDRPSTAAAARPKIATSGWRRPRGSSRV
jgi:hypothetical protein